MTDPNLLKELRDETGLSFDKIKKALDEANGDRAAALQVLQSQAGAVAAKKADRAAKDGLVASYIHVNGKLGALVALACETDFVAKNDAFKALAHELAMHAAAMQPTDATEMLAQPFVKDPSLTVQDVINQAVQKLGENIRLSGISISAIG